MWLARRYPDIAAETASGHRVGWGARQEVNFAHAAYRFHAERVIRAVVGRYREHPAIIGYQVDNEPGPRLLYNTDVFEKFVDWLRRQYGTVDRLNEEWGLVYWSHRLSRWSDLWRPEGNFQPQYDLAWRRFQAELVTEFIGWQAGIVRELTGGRGFVTTCISYEQPGVEDAELSRALDVASGNAYYEMQDSLAHPGTLPRSSGPTGWVVRGPWAVTQLADLMYSSKQAPFMVTETNAHRVLALEDPVVRRRDVLGWRASAQRYPGPRLPRDRADRPGTARGRRRLRRGRTRLRHRGALRLRQQVRAVDAGAAAG
jgi:beta-galactosidase